MLAILFAAIVAVGGCGGSKSSAGPKSSASSTPSNPAGGTSTSLCDAMKTFAAKMNAIGDANDEASGKASAAQASASVDAMVASAPAGLKADVAVVSAALRSMVSEMTTSGDFFKAMEAFQDDKVTKANDRLDKYATDHCKP